jgi:serine/threonine protein phosphatase PrpC
MQCALAWKCTTSHASALPAACIANLMACSATCFSWGQLQVDKHFVDKTGRTRTCGSTATLLLLRGRTAYVAHVGDTRAVLATKTGAVVQLTKDHKADDPSEGQRIRVRALSAPAFILD